MIASGNDQIGRKEQLASHYYDCIVIISNWSVIGQDVSAVILGVIGR